MKNITNKKIINYLIKKINILLYVANDVEYSTTYDFLANPVEIINEGIQYVVGKIESYYIALIKGGSIGPTQSNSVYPTIQKACNFFTGIEHLITIGVCCSINDKVKRGDVVVANVIADYESVKVDSKIIDRSSPITVDNQGNIISSVISRMNFRDFKIFFGKIITGAKLVKNRKFILKLKSIHPEAIALDMEGYEIAKYYLANKLKSWLFIKSASDKGTNKKGSEGQSECTKNSLKVLKEILCNPYIYPQPKIKVLLSGSFVFDNQDTKYAEKFSYDLTKALINKNYKIINGYGKCIGNSIVAGAYDSQNYQDTKKSLQDIIEIYPFPRIINEDIANSINVIKTNNRQLMAKDCSFTIFLFGLKDNNEDAKGMDDEFTIADNNSSFLVPIGATGYKSEKLWMKVNKDINNYYPFNSERFIEFFNKLNIKTDPQKIISNVIKFIECIDSEIFN